MKFTREQRLLHNLILHSNDIPARGLMDGQMGIILVLSEYIRTRKALPLKTGVKFLLDQVIDNLTVDMSLEFANGLTGIGWGIEYLLQHKFQRGLGAVICDAIDKQLMSRNLQRQTDLSLETGFEGWLHYIILHLQGAMQTGCQVFDKEFLDDCLTTCNNLLRQNVQPSLNKLCHIYIAFMEGESMDYDYGLSCFISSVIKPNTPYLGLRNGIAGQLFNLIKLDAR